MATKFLKAVQEIAHDQLTVASTIQDIIDTWHIYVDEIEDLEVTPFGANQFLISLLFLYLQQEMRQVLVRCYVVLGRIFKTAKIRTSIAVLRTIKTDLFGFIRPKTSSILLALIKTFTAKYLRKLVAVSELVAVLDLIFYDIDLQLASLKLALLSMDHYLQKFKKINLLLLLISAKIAEYLRELTVVSKLAAVLDYVFNDIDLPISSFIVRATISFLSFLQRVKNISLVLALNLAHVLTIPAKTASFVLAKAGFVAALSVKKSISVILDITNLARIVNLSNTNGKNIIILPCTREAWYNTIPC